MPKAQIQMIQGDKIDGANVDYSDSLPVNLYAVKKDIHGAKGYMIQYPGISSFGTGSGADRGGVYNERLKKHFRVSGTRFIEISETGAVTDLGEIPGTGRASMPYSFQSQLIVSDGRAFRYTTSSGLVEMTDIDLGSPIDAAWVDNYYFFTDGEYIYHTDISDETAIDPLKYATAEFMPDDSIAVAKTDGNKVCVFGKSSIEYFVDVANENFSFQRLDARNQKIGIVSTHAKAEKDGIFYIVGKRENDQVGVYAISTGESTKISTRSIDKLLSKYSDGDYENITVDSISIDGSIFILFHLKLETLCFCLTIAQAFGPDVAWTILKSDVNGDTPYRGTGFVFDPRCGKWICGDRSGSSIGCLDGTVSTHYGELAEWIIETPFIGLESASVNSIMIETIPGHNITDDATCALSVSMDGVTHGREFWLSFGTTGEYSKQFGITRVGQIPSWCSFKLRGASKSRVAFAKMELDYA